jgi:ketosteroid isomerase-like protein
MSKASLILLITVLTLGVGGCGGSRTSGHSVSNASAGTPSPAALMGDQDRDSPGGSYYDRDDGEIRSYGYVASATDASAITALVERYYAAAAEGDGVKACALTYRFDVETLPEKYGRPPGPRWLHGANTCQALLARVFQHFHGSLTAPVVVTSVRVDGSHADALVGFRTLPAGFVKARREGGAWKIDGLLAAPLP